MVSYSSSWLSWWRSASVWLQASCALTSALSSLPGGGVGLQPCSTIVVVERWSTLSRQQVGGRGGSPRAIQLHTGIQQSWRVAACPLWRLSLKATTHSMLCCCVHVVFVVYMLCLLCCCVLHVLLCCCVCCVVVLL